MARIVPLLVSTQQSQNDMKGRNDAGDNIHHCRGCASSHCGNTAVRNFSSRLKWLWKPFEIMATATEWLKNASALPD
jgi:hypothetical protein